MVYAIFLANYSEDRSHWLYEYKLQNTLLNPSEEDFIGLQWLTAIEGPGLLDASFKLKMHNERIFAAKEVDE